MLFLLLLLIATGLTVILILLCACRVGHMEDVQRGFAEDAGHSPFADRCGSRTRTSCGVPLVQDPR